MVQVNITLWRVFIIASSVRGQPVFCRLPWPSFMAEKREAVWSSGLQGRTTWLCNLCHLLAVLFGTNSLSSPSPSFLTFEMGLKTGVLTVRNIYKAPGTNKGSDTGSCYDRFGLINHQVLLDYLGHVLDVGKDIEVPSTKRATKFGAAYCRLFTF